MADQRTEDLRLIDCAREHGYEYPSVPCGECGEPTYFLPGYDETPTLDTFRDWYGNGDQGEEFASDGMGNGACLYRLDNGELWVFQWDDAGFEDCGQVTREEWERISGSYYVEEDES